MRFLTNILFVCLFLTSCVVERGWLSTACTQGMESAVYFVAQTDEFEASSYSKALAEEILQTKKNAQEMISMNFFRGPTDFKNKLGLKTPAESHAFCVQTTDEIKRLSPKLKSQQ